jgi:hypothetical protein
MGKRGAQVLLERIANREKPFPPKSSWPRSWSSANPPAPRESRLVKGSLIRRRLKPAADVHLRVRFAAVVPRVGRVGGFLRPFENRQLRVVAMDHDPAHRIVALLAANLTSINGADHG